MPNVEVRWAPGHTDIEGNEAADNLADAEAKEPSTPFGLAAQPTVSGIRTIRKAQLAIARAAWWNSAKSKLSNWYTQWKLPYQPTRPPQELELTRPTLARLLAIRTSHGDFAWYHRKFHHDNATLECSCGRPKTPCTSHYVGKPQQQTSSGDGQDGHQHRLGHLAKQSNLSITGQDDYRTDLEAYKLRIESYKYKENAYKEEQAKYDQLIRHIVDTVSPHLQLTCCDLSKPIRDWIKLLQETVGIDSEDERLRARERYQNALRPMRTPGHWETWLTEYDQAATRAESLGVSEVQNVQDVINDFLGAIGKIAPSWKATFSGPGYDPATMNRKKVMKLFRDHMSQSNPSKGKQKSAFAAGEVSFLAGGESDQDIQGDASGNTRVWIQGYGTVRIRARDLTGERIIRLDNAALCPDIHCNLVSFRLLRHQGIWWDNKAEPTLLRRQDNTVIAILEEMCNQWVIERQDQMANQSYFSSRTRRPDQRATAMVWHKRLGHPGPAAIEHLVHHSQGVRIKGITTVECDACGRSKSRRQIRRAPRINDEGPGERIALDFHSYEEGSSTKEKSQLLILDRYSRYTWDFYFKDNRPARSIIKLLETFLKFLHKQFNITVKAIESDNEITMVKSEVGRWCTSQGIKLEPSAPDTQSQNGGAERSGGVIKEKSRAMRLDANLPWELWPEITRAAVYLYNRTPNYSNRWTTPYEKFFTRVAALNGIVTGPRKPDQTHLKAYGCKAFAMTDDTHRGKSRLQRLDPKAWIGYLVISTRDVVFDENTVFDGKTEDLMDNLMHSTLEEIATWVRSVELPAYQTNQPETETFFEDDATEDYTAESTSVLRQSSRIQKGKEVQGGYPTPPDTPPPAAFLTQTIQEHELRDQGTSRTIPWAAAFMAGLVEKHQASPQIVQVDKRQEALEKLGEAGHE
ncbi:polyprotein [Pyrenophora tritici-repentis]|nr:polyprotein [Pyrenophora tritici-repentis]